MVDNATSFMDLNTDCLLTIFDDLNVTDLLSLTETNTNLLDASTATLKRRFAKKEVKVRFGNSDKKFEITENAVEIYFIDTKRLEFVKILQNFSHLLSNLEINANVLHINITNFVEQVNSYCFESLTKLCIWTFNQKHIFDAIKMPFKSVEHLSIWGNFDYVNKLTLTEMFPALRVFKSNFYTIEKQTLINQNYPNLKYLHVEEINSNYGLNENSFKTLIANNLQICGLNLDFFYITDGLKFLQFVAESLPHLEHLVLSECKERNDSNESINIHFEYLKTLKIRRSGPVLPLNTTFGRLEELATGPVYSKNSDRWMELVKHQKTLKKLTVTQYIKDSDILQIANADSNLIELNYNCGCDLASYQQSVNACGCDVKIESMVEMLEKSKQLQKVNLRSGWAASDSVFYTLQRKLPGWTITRVLNGYRADYVHFERTESF